MRDDRFPHDERAGEANRYGDAISRGCQAARENRDQLEAGESAELLCERLVHLPRERRDLLLNNLPTATRQPLCEILLRRAYGLRHAEPRRMRHLTRLAIRVGEGIRPSAGAESLVSDLRCEARAQLGLAHRILGEHQAAEKAFDDAEEIRLRGTGDPLLKARLRILRGDLFFDQKRHGEAIRHFRRAYGIYRGVRDDHLAGKALLAIGRTFGDAGELHKGIRYLYEGGRLVDSQRDPSLSLEAIHNLVHYLSRAGHTQEALALLQEARPLYDLIQGDVLMLRVQSLEGQLSAALGRTEEAIAALEGARAGFAEMEMPYDAALISLELAALYAEAGKNREIRQLARAMYPIFASKAIPREAAATLLLFVQAAEAEAVTASWVRHLLHKVEAAG